MDNEFVCSYCEEKLTTLYDLDKHEELIHPDIHPQADNIANSEPENFDEQSISGSLPDPESDDDLLEDVHEVGEQVDEDEEHPKEVDLARDIDEGEEYSRTH